MVKAVGYCRFSSELQSDGYSIQAQKEAITLFAQANDYSIVKWYVDEAKSGTSIDGRPAFQMMLDEAKEHRFNAVIVHKLDRFARSRADSAIAKKILKSNNVKVVSVLERFDDSPESIILESVLDGMSEYYSRNLAREVTKGQIQAVKSGHVISSLPYGYYIDKEKKAQVDEDKARIVRFIFESYDDDVSLAEIARRLNAQGIKSPEGKQWSSGLFGHMLRQRAYIGEYTVGGKIYKGITPPIVETELFDRVQAKREQSRKSRNTDSRKRSDQYYMLTGLLYLETESGTLVRMNGHTSYQRAKNRAYPTYMSRIKPYVSVNKTFIEQAVCSAVLDMLVRDEVINRITSIVNKELSEVNRDRRSRSELEHELARAEKQSEQCIDLYLDGKITLKEFDKRRAELDERKRNIEAQLAGSVRFIEKVDENAVRIGLNFYRQYIVETEANQEQTARLLKSLLNRIIYNREESSITLKLKKIDLLGSVSTPEQKKTHNAEQNSVSTPIQQNEQKKGHTFLLRFEQEEACSILSIKYALGFSLSTTDVCFCSVC